MRVCVCMCVYMCVCVCVWVYMFVCERVSMCLGVHVWITGHACTFMCVCFALFSVFHELMHVVAVAALATYLDQLLAVISHILQDSEYHQVCS